MSEKERESFNKKQLIDDTILRIEKSYGKGSIMLLGANSDRIDVEAVSTGSFVVDRTIGIGGIPRGRITEIYGPEASGKTTLALQTIAEVQKLGGSAAFIDAEHALDISYAQNIGIQIDQLLVSQPDFGEQALEIVDILVRSNVIDVIVVDSVAALVPKSELDGDMGDTHVGLQARLMSQALRKLAAVVNKSRCVLIFINQIRQNISSMPFVQKETTPGGNALKFYASLRLEVRKSKSLKDNNGVHYGNEVTIKVVKNKVQRPFGVAHSYLIFGVGMSKHVEIIDISLEKSILSQQGSWFYFGETRLCQGREKLLDLIKNDLSLYTKLCDQCFDGTIVKSNSGDLSLED